jgi:hypothetical protein
MFRLVWFVFRVVFRLKIVLLSMAAGAAIAGGLHVREQSRTWGLLPGDAERELPGDDLVVGPKLVETRSLVIEAAPAQVWPWLVQMGFERGGWYSFVPLDRAWSPGGGAPRHSAETILPEFQDLAVGDIVPTYAGGGFVAKVVEPGAALVLYLDDVMVREQAHEQTADHPVADGVGVRDMDMPAFRVSWAFILEAEPDGGTRLVERIRMHIRLTAPQRRGVPMLGLGLFTLMRSQMLGIKRRAEGTSPQDA